MRGLPQKQNARRADKIRLCGHLGRYKKIVKKTYIIYIKDTINNYMSIVVSQQEKMESSDLKKVILATVGFAVFFCLLLTVFPYREQPAGNGKEHKNAKNVKELKRKRAEHNSTEREEDTK